MQAGYVYALENGYEVAVQVDGDGQHDPRFIHELLARLCGEPGLNMVTGSRFLEPSSDGYRSSAARRVAPFTTYVGTSSRGGMIVLPAISLS
jgi:hypothetical protein